MSQVASVKRYIDDGASQFKGTVSSLWIERVNDGITHIGLENDEHEIENTGSFVSFRISRSPSTPLDNFKLICMSRKPTLDHIYTLVAATQTISSLVSFAPSAYDCGELLIPLSA
jgi:hypothetical protein